MRNTIVGVALAVVLLAALFAASQFGSHPAPQPAARPAPTPAEIAGAVKDDFVGRVKIGAWRLICGKGRELPKPPPLQAHEDNPRAKNGPPPGWRIPRCQVMLGLRNPKNPDEEIRVTFRHFGFKRVPAIFLRLPPADVATGDVATLLVDAAERPIPVRACSARFCIAIDSIKFADLPAIAAAKRMMLSFTPTGGPQPVAIPIPTLGLAQALDTLRRIDK